METVIKQAEENRGRSVSLANRFHEEYIPLKGEIDTMRRDYLGLERLPELHEEEGTIITPEVFSRFQHTNYYSSGKLSQPGSASFTRPSTGLSTQSNVHQMQPTTDSPHVTPLNQLLDTDFYRHQHQT